MKKLLLTLGLVASVAAPVAAVVACSSDNDSSVKAINLSVASGQPASQTMIPTTSWYSTDNWDRNMYLYNKDTEALDAVLSATGKKLDIDSAEFKTILSDLKGELQGAVQDEDLYQGISKPKVQEPKKNSSKEQEKLPAKAIELMVHDAPYTSVAQAKGLIGTADAGKAKSEVVIFNVLYIKLTDMGKFLDNMNDHMDILVRADDASKNVLATWKVIYNEAKASL